MSIAEMQTVQLALIAVAALALALQTIFMIVVLVMARGAVRALREEMEHYRSSVAPVILKTRELVQNVAPKIEEAATEISEMAKALREQAADLQSAADDIIARTQRQAGRVDHMLTTLFDRVERAGSFVAGAVVKPMRQISGLMASVRAVVETLRDKDAGHAHPPQESARYAGEHAPAERPSGIGSSYRP